MLLVFIIRRVEFFHNFPEPSDEALNIAIRFYGEKFSLRDVLSDATMKSKSLNDFRTREFASLYQAEALTGCKCLFRN
jgi:hypothetical protein